MSFSITATSTYFNAYQYELKANNVKNNTVASSKLNNEQSSKTSQATTQPDNASTQNIATSDNQPEQDSNQYNKVMTGSEIIASMPAKADKVTDKDKSKDSSNSTASEGEAEGLTAETLTEEEKKEVQELKKRDAEVKTHEQAHLTAGGSYVRGGASYSYETGPDGMKYATGGEVQIDTAPIDGDPEATIIKAQAVRSAALAPAQPSSQDQAVAAQASKMMQEAQAELMEKNMAESSGKSKDEANNVTDSSEDNQSEISSGILPDKQSNNTNNGKSTIESVYPQYKPTNTSESEQINLVA